MMYIIPIGTVGKQTGTPAANQIIWSIRNLGSLTVRIRRIKLTASFSGTAAATVAQYYFQRFRTATPTTGTALTVILGNTGLGASGVTDAREALAGLTTTGATNDTAVFEISCPRQNGCVSPFVIDFPRGDGPYDDGFQLTPNDGLWIGLGTAGVIGDCLTGHIEYDEF